MTCCAEGREGAEDGQAHGAHVANIDEAAVTEAGGPEVHARPGGQRQLRPEARSG